MLLHGLRALGDLVDDVVDVCAAFDGADGIDEAHLHAAMQGDAAGTAACLPLCAQSCKHMLMMCLQQGMHFAVKQTCT